MGVKQKLEDEEKEFLEKKREFEKKMIEFEKEEICKRQLEVKKKEEILEELKKKNRMVENTVVEQIKFLSNKLEDFRSTHRSSEKELESEISDLNRLIAEVRAQMLERSKPEDDLTNPPEYDELVSHTEAVSPTAPVAPVAPPQMRPWTSVH